MPVDLRVAEPHDPAWFAPRLRPADTAELVAASGPDVRATLERALEQSLGKAWAAMLGEEPIALFGLAPFGLLASSAAPWTVTSTCADRRRDAVPCSSVARSASR